MTGKSDEIKVQAKSDLYAAENRELFRKHRLFVVNLIGSPGCGKTSLLEETVKRLSVKSAVIEGDVKTDADAQRIRAAGAPAVQIETGGACHLNARQVADAAKSFDLDSIDILFIENVGNLVCPSGFDLGENLKIAVTSLPEGDEKPSKYPSLFVRAGAVVINKTDLLPHLDYSIERASSDCRKLNSHARIFELSCKTGDGFDQWIAFLEESAAELSS